MGLTPELTLGGDAGLNVVSGWTGPLDFVCLEDGAPADISTAADVSLRLFDKVQDPVAFAGTFIVTSGEVGAVRFTPSGIDIADIRAPYTARVRVTGSAGDVRYYPSAAADVWTVNPEAK